LQSITVIPFFHYHESHHITSRPYPQDRLGGCSDFQLQIPSMNTTLTILNQVRY
jgi:hypothetical protein